MEDPSFTPPSVLQVGIEMTDCKSDLPELFWVHTSTDLLATFKKKTFSPILLLRQQWLPACHGGDVETAILEDARVQLDRTDCMRFT